MERDNSAQAIFERVSRHLLKQNKRSMRFQSTLKLPGMMGTGGCAYRGHDGTMCAIGSELTDEEYKPEMEGLFLTNSQEQTLVDLGLLPERLLPHVPLLEELQRVHDTDPVGMWNICLQDVGYRFKLDISFLENK